MEQLINFIIRPPRAVYNPTSDLLDQEFMLKGEWFQRKDLEVVNSRGNVLQCSHYMPLKNLEGMALPCVIYCHGNSGCRADASEAAIILLPSYITVFTLDFSGSGLSEGEHVTLGCNEKDDLKVVVNHLRADGKTSCIGLWGRSMGAVTSLMYGVEDPSIAGMVLDSPFSNLIDLMMELVDTTKFPLPKFTVKYAIHFMRKAIQRKAKFDIMDLDTIQVAKCCFVPALLGHAMDDDFIQPHHSDRIYDSYAGDKNIIKFEGDHNSPRPQFYFDSITIFFHNVLHPPKDASGRNFLQTEHDISDKGSWDTMHGMGYIDHYSLEKPFLKELATSSTEDAITHLRSRKPHMSKTEVPGVSRMQEKLYESEEKEAERSFGSSDVPGLSETDDYFVEHAFDGVTYFPCDIEDENRMIMAAVLESLKDLETGHALENPPPDVGTTSQDTSPQDNSQASTAEYTKHTAEVNNSTSASDVHDSHREPPRTPDLVRPGGSLVAASSQYNEASAVQSSTGSDISATGHGSSDGEISAQQHTDMAGGGHVNQAVQRVPTNHIMSGLAHRWGLNFFRNSE